MPKVIFTMGIPGAGKSRRVRETFPALAVVDCDAIKETLPGYDPFDPCGVHAESQRVRDVHYREALARGVSFISDSTGTNAERIVTEARAAKAAGFDVHLFYVIAPLSVALARNAARSRRVPETIVRAKAQTIGAAFDIAAPEFDAVTVVYNGQQERNLNR